MPRGFRAGRDQTRPNRGKAHLGLRHLLHLIAVHAYKPRNLDLLSIAGVENCISPGSEKQVSVSGLSSSEWSSNEAPARSHFLSVPL